MTHEVQRFVGRAAEIREALEQVHGLQRGLAAQTCLVNYYGTYGVGKQALLAELLRRTADEPGLTTVALTLPAQEAQEREPAPAAKQALLGQLAAGGVPPGDAPDDDQALAQAAAALLARPGPTLLLIGGESRGTPALFGWVERGLLLPLVRAGRAAALITSRTPLRWREFDTRRRADSRELAPLTTAETAAQLGLGPEQAAAVQRITFGLPLANTLAQEELVAGGAADLRGPRGAALARRIIAMIYERAGPGLTPELRCALEVLAVAREFALPLIQALLPPFCPEFAQPRSQALQLATIRQLQELDLVTWNQQSLSYQITPLVRRLVASAVRREDPARYGLIQRAAAAYYARQLDEVPISRHVHLAELLWHTLDGDRDGVSEPAVALARLATTYLASSDGRHVDEESLGALRGRLSADEELHTLLAARGSGLAPVLQALDGVGVSRSTAS